MHMIARGLRENRVFLVTSILILFILLIAFLAPHIAPYDPLSASMSARQPVSFPLMQAASSISSSCVSLT